MRHILGSCVMIVWLSGCGGSATTEDGSDGDPVEVRADGGKGTASDGAAGGGGGGAGDVGMVVQKSDAGSGASDARTSSVDAGRDATDREDRAREDAARSDAGKGKPRQEKDGGRAGPGDDDDDDAGKLPTDGGQPDGGQADGGRPRKGQA